MEEAVTLAESMDARGHGRGRRTRYRPARWTPAAIVVVGGLARGGRRVRHGRLDPARRPASVDLPARLARGAASAARRDRAARDPRLRPAADGRTRDRSAPRRRRLVPLSRRGTSGAHRCRPSTSTREPSRSRSGPPARASRRSCASRTASSRTSPAARSPGRVFVDGRDTLAHPPRALADAVAFVPQDPGASFVLDRVEDELAYGMENLGVDPAHMRRRVEEMLDLLDIEPLRTRSVRSISGGERQRVAIAAALAAGPTDPRARRAHVAARSAGRRARRRRAPAARARPGHDRDPRRAPAGARRRLGRPGPRVRRGPRDRGRPRRGDPAARPGAAGRTTRPVGRLGPGAAHGARRAAAGGPARPSGSATRARCPATRRVELSAASRRDTATPRPCTTSTSTAGEGEIVAVMGRNGAGKTTLLRSIAGVHAPASGSVRVGGARPASGDRRRALSPGARVGALRRHRRATRCARHAEGARDRRRAAEPLLDELGHRRARRPAPARPVGRPAAPRRDRRDRRGRGARAPARRADARARSGGEGTPGAVPAVARRRRRRPRCSPRTTSSWRRRSPPAS